MTKFLNTQNTKQKGPPISRWAFLKNVRRRPTLPHRNQCSTIGSEGLNFRVRNGTGCFPFDKDAETLLSYVLKLLARNKESCQSEFEPNFFDSL
jgi:hypothetical protein